jgi:cytochrome c oxidase assembly protein Cox11
MIFIGWNHVTNKIKTEQKLNAGEEVDMPVFFFIDPDFLEDPQMKGIETVTLSYTFFSEYSLQELRFFHLC